MASATRRAVVTVSIIVLFTTALTESVADPTVDVSEPRGELTLPAAISAALARNAELRGSAYALRAAEGRVAQAGVRPNPELSLELENFGGTGSAHGTALLESTLSLDQVIELGAKRERRVDVAMAERETAEIERDARQLDVLAEVTRRFVDVVRAQEEISLTRRAADIAERTLSVISARVAAARAPEAEESRAHIALARAHIDEQRAKHELQTARRALAASWGSTAAPMFDIASADLYTLPSVVTFESLEQRMRGNPELARFASEARLREAELRLVRAEAAPDVTVSAGLRRLDETDDIAIVAGVSWPLRISDHRQGAISEAEARREQALAEQEAAYIRVSTTVFELYQALEQAGVEAMTLHDQAIPQAESALEQSREGYERGRFSYLELATAQEELIDVRRAAIAAAANYHSLLAEIERLTNEPLSRSAEN